MSTIETTNNISAEFVRSMEGFAGSAKLWKLSQSVLFSEDSRTEFVITSAAIAMFSGPETYIFPADGEGNVLSWGEMEGSYCGGLNHEQAIQNAGWSIQ